MVWGPIADSGVLLARHGDERESEPQQEAPPFQDRRPGFRWNHVNNSVGNSTRPAPPSQPSRPTQAFSRAQLSSTLFPTWGSSIDFPNHLDPPPPPQPIWPTPTNPPPLSTHTHLTNPDPPRPFPGCSEVVRTKYYFSNLGFPPPSILLFIKKVPSCRLAILSGMWFCWPPFLSGMQGDSEMKAFFLPSSLHPPPHL